MSHADRHVEECRKTLVDIYAGVEASARWTPAQEQELADAIDTLEAAEAAITAALTEARNDLMNCVDAGSGTDSAGL